MPAKMPRFYHFGKYTGSQLRARRERIAVIGYKRGMNAREWISMEKGIILITWKFDLELSVESLNVAHDFIAPKKGKKKYLILYNI